MLSISSFQIGQKLESLLKFLGVLPIIRNSCFNQIIHRSSYRWPKSTSLYAIYKLYHIEKFEKRHWQFSSYIHYSTCKLEKIFYPWNFEFESPQLIFGKSSFIAIMLVRTEYPQLRMLEANFKTIKIKIVIKIINILTTKRSLCNLTNQVWCLKLQIRFLPITDIHVCM
jgi:hypothetical protein